MKLYLVHKLESAKYYGIVDGTAEIWAAESPEQVWDMKYPDRAGDWLPDFEPKIEDYGGEPTKEFNIAYRKWECKKDKLKREYLEIKKAEIESYKELPHMTTDVVEPQMVFSENFLKYEW